MSLRARLVATSTSLLALGLAVAGIAVFGGLRTYLVDRVDEQLDAARIPARALLADGPVFDSPRLGSAVARVGLPPGAYLELRDRDGSTRQAATFGLTGQDDDRPDLPSALPGSGDPDSRRLFTAGSSDGHDFRVLAEALPRGGTAVVALPLDGVRDTLRRLVAVELAVAGLALAGVGALSWWLTGVGLRPLDRIATTAGAIADGDLSRRVAEDDRSEVGRLGASLNAMLGQIEDAFAERRRSEDRLRRFLADASHELRTPLTSIRGYAELFRRGADRRPEDLATAMRRIEEESARMSQLVDDLLQLARLDENPALDLVPVDLAVLAADAAADARVAQPSRPVTVDAPGPAVVLGDEDRLRQLVGNLVANALAHTPTSSAVTVHATRTADDIVVEVTDEGPGMDAATAERVFERFNRGDLSRSRTGAPGVGLGLAIVAAVAAAHGGTVDVDTAPDRGTAFRVRLPAGGPGQLSQQAVAT